MEYFLEYIYGGTKNLDPSTGGGTTNKNMKSVPKLFTVNVSGTYATVNYCPMGINCRPSNKPQAIMRCEKKGETCYTFAVGKKIVWKNNKNPKGKLRIKSKDLKNGALHVAKIIQEAGYYDGDITLLEGVGIDNSQSENTNIKNESKGNTVDQLETLTKLYEAGSLTKDEFEKAKKKILSD